MEAGGERSGERGEGSPRGGEAGRTFSSAAEKAEAVESVTPITNRRTFIATDLGQRVCMRLWVTPILVPRIRVAPTHRMLEILAPRRP